MSKHKKNMERNCPESESVVEEEIEQPVDVAEEDSAENSTAVESDELEILKGENQKLKEDYLRAFAEAENTKKRCQQEIEKNTKFALTSFAKSLLGVADNLQRAIDAAANNRCEDNEALLKGVELTQNELNKAFDKFDIHKMEIMGTVFNPNFHQVIQEVEDKTKPAGTIIAEVQTGYMIHDRILREAMVVVTKA
jgi:molecular chaperone GrpE